MNISGPFIIRPVATILLTLAIVLAGGVAFFLLPVSSLPQIDIPTIAVSASLPGASPETRNRPVELTVIVLGPSVMVPDTGMCVESTIWPTTLPVVAGRLAPERAPNASMTP